MNEKVIQLRPTSYSEKLGNYIKQLEEENNELQQRLNKAIEELKTANNVDIDSDRLCEIIECAIHILEEGSEE
jgi:hypothetical protein